MTNETEDYSEVIQILGMTEDAFYDWQQSFKPDYKIIKTVDADGWDEVNCVYTDGDGGVMLFKGFSEIFEWKGIETSCIGSWCDLCIDTFVNIAYEMEEAMARVEKTNRERKL